METGTAVSKKVSVGRWQTFWFIVVMAVVTIVTVAIASRILYLAAFQEQEQRLLETARSRARLIEAVVSHETNQKIRYGHNEDIFDIVLAQMVEAHRNFEGFGETGEFTLAEFRNGQIYFLLKHRHENTTSGGKNNGPFKMGADLAEPMQRVLRGDSGVMTGTDYRGEKVLAAFEPVRAGSKRVGIVAKIDLAEIRRPFIRSARTAAALGFLIILAGALIFRRISSPLLKEIAESEERFRSTFEQAAVGMAHVAPDGKWLFVNETLCHLVGYSRDELLKKTFQDITCKHDRTVGIESSERMVAGEIENYSAEKRYVRKEGDLIWVNVNVSLVRNPTGEPKYYISVIKDISARKRAEEELSQKRRLAAMGEMSAHIAHDIRSPLNSIGLAYKCLKGVKSLPESDRKSLEYLGQGIDTLTDLSTDLLDFGRSDQLKKQRFDLQKLIDRVLIELEENIAAKNLKTILKMEAESHLLDADKVKMRQVFTNIVDNAIHPMKRGGTLTIASERNENALIVTVSDTGEGIPKADLKNIFVPFFTTKRKGTGLGMSIVKHYIELHLGEITLKSRPGKGTKVTVSLPCGE